MWPKRTFSSTFFFLEPHFVPLLVLFFLILSGTLGRNHAEERGEKRRKDKEEEGIPRRERRGKADRKKEEGRRDKSLPSLPSSSLLSSPSFFGVKYVTEEKKEKGLSLFHSSSRTFFGANVRYPFLFEKSP